jgi:hypothetical protein
VYEITNLWILVRILALPRGGAIPAFTGHSESVSSEPLDFFRAQGPPVTLELPLVTNSNEIVPLLNNGMDPENDYSIRALARQLGLHQVFGPPPSVHMLILEILEKAAIYHHDNYIPRPISTGLASFQGLRQKWIAFQQPVQEKYPGYLVDSDDEPFAFDPFWGNNLEASSSTAPPIKLCLPWNSSTTKSSASDYVDTPHSLDAAPLEVVSMYFASDQQLPHGMDAAVQLVDAQLSDEQVLQ